MPTSRDTPWCRNTYITFNIIYIYIFILYMFDVFKQQYSYCSLPFGWHHVTNVTFGYINMFPLQTKDPISQAQQVGFAVTITGVLLWSRLKLQEQARLARWQESMNGLRAVLVSLETVMIFGSNAVFFTKKQVRKGLSKFCGIYPFTSAVVVGWSMALARHRLTDSEIQNACLWLSRSCGGCRAAGCAGWKSPLQVVTCCTGKI